MKLIIFLCSASIFCTFLSYDCGRGNLENSKMNQNTTISELEKISGLKLPENSEIIFYDSEREEGGYQQWVIHSTRQIEINQETRKADSQSSLALFKNLPPGNYDFGEIKNPDSLSGSWENKAGRWQSQMVETTKGFYLYLELFG